MAGCAQEADPGANANPAETGRRHEPVAISAITLLEIAVLFGESRNRSDVAFDELLDEFDSIRLFRLFR